MRIPTCLFGQKWCNEHQLRCVWCSHVFRNAKFIVHHYSIVPTCFRSKDIKRSPTNIMRHYSKVPQPVPTCKETNSPRKAKVKVKANQNDPPETWLQEGVLVGWCLFWLQELCLIESFCPCQSLLHLFVSMVCWCDMLHIPNKTTGWKYDRSYSKQRSTWILPAQTKTKNSLGWIHFFSNITFLHRNPYDISKVHIFLELESDASERLACWSCVTCRDIMMKMAVARLLCSVLL